MAQSELELDHAEQQMIDLRSSGYAISARYDRRKSRIVVDLNTGVQFAFPTQMAEGLYDASPESLADIEISPAGLGLRWPQLDADVYIPAILQGIFGSKTWMAQQLGATGGRARSKAKASASRENGRRGGRPKKSAAA